MDIFKETIVKPLVKENRLTLSRLKGGIPQLLLMECLNFQDIKSTGHYIMLK